MPTRKRGDPRYPWFIREHGDKCWELDALDPRVLRDAVEYEIERHILDREAWDRVAIVEKAERASMRDVLSWWSKT